MKSYQLERSKLAILITVYWYFLLKMIIPGRRSRLSGVAGATCPDMRSHPVLIDVYLARDGSRP